MAEGRRDLEVVYNVDRILDAHTHLTGQENEEGLLECLDACGVERAFVFAPMPNVQAHEITSDSMLTTGLLGSDPSAWDLKVDVSFGPAADYQLEVWQRCINTLPAAMLMYGTDPFWPMGPEEYREQYPQPQLGLFETATTLGHIVQ